MVRGEIADWSDQSETYVRLWLIGQQTFLARDQFHPDIPCKNLTLCVCQLGHGWLRVSSRPPPDSRECLQQHWRIPPTVPSADNRTHGQDKPQKSSPLSPNTPGGWLMCRLCWTRLKHLHNSCPNVSIYWNIHNSRCCSSRLRARFRRRLCGNTLSIRRMM